MSARSRRAILPLIGVSAMVCAAVWAQSSQSAHKRSSGSDYKATAEGLVAELYKSVSYEANEPTDWDKVRGLFVPEAVIVLRTSREKMSIFSVDGFIDDFVNFNEKSGAGRKGFTEKVVKLKPLVFGDIAHVLVLYEAHITGLEKPPQRGVDSFELVRKDDRWWITSINNDICTPQRPAPRELQE